MAREEAQSSGSTTGIDLYALLRIRLLVAECPVRKLHPSVGRIAFHSVRFVGQLPVRQRIELLLGSIPALKMILGTMSNNIYMQIALIMLMGLLAKNAILIVEFALDRRKHGYEYHVGSRIGCRRPSASYPDDLIGHG